jgi:excinuclease ABC subunit A
MIGRFRGYTRCPACGGARLKPDALAVRLGGQSIAGIGDLTLGALLEWLRSLGPGSAARRLAGPLVDDLVARIGTLVDVGLDYVTL